MNSVREYHNEAIRHAQLAMVALHKGDADNHRQLVQHAMLLEKQAADMVPDERASEPTRSILYRSAASFAYQAGEFEEAERLVFKGMAGYPPVQVKRQLLEVQQMIQAVLSHQQQAESNLNLLAKQIVAAIYENGALRPIVALPLKEHQRVEIQILPSLEGIL